jgi:intraflagellar transport protein 46
MASKRSDDDSGSEESEGSSELDSEEESSEESDSDSGGGGGGGKREEANVKNMPFDEALELSASMDPGPNAANNKQRGVQNAPHDEEFDVSASMDHPEPGQGGPQGKGLNSSIVNKPYDEQVNLSDEDSGSESSIDTNANSPRVAQPKAVQQQQQQGAKSSAPARGREEESDEESSSSEEESQSAEAPGAGVGMGGAGGQGAPINKLPGAGAGGGAGAGNGSGGVDGGYKPEAYNNLNVSAEVKELFQYIQRYSPHDVELETRLKCFVPDYIPAVGELDAFLKVPRPDGESDELGLKLLDEPAAHQSDPTVLELQLRAISKKKHGDAAVRSIENAEKTPREITKWIESIEKLHRSKPPCQVHYTKAMPEVETLMQVWPEQFEEMLSKGEIQLPSTDLDMSVNEFARLICILLDIPVYDGKVTESLHVLFTLFSEFKTNQHFMGLGGENPDGTAASPKGGMGAPMGGGGGGGFGAAAGAGGGGGGGADIMSMGSDYK